MEGFVICWTIEVPVFVLWWAQYLVDDSDAEHIRILMTITTIAVMKMNSFFCMHLWWLRLCWWWQHSLLVTMKMMIVTKRTSKCFVQVLLLQPFAVVATNRPKPSIFEAPSDAKTANFSTDPCSSFLSFVLRMFASPQKNYYSKIQLYIFCADPYIYSKQCWDGELDVNVIKHRSAGNGWIFPSASQKLLWQ